MDNNTLATIAGLALTGTIVSAVVEYTKNFLAKSGHRILYTIGISIVGGVGLYFSQLIPMNVIQTVLGVWVAANTVYLVVIKNLNDQSSVTLPPTPPAIPTA